MSERLGSVLSAESDKVGDPDQAQEHLKRKPTVAIFAEPLIAPSMTFIRDQASALTEFTALYVSPQRASPSLEVPPDRAVVLCDDPRASPLWNRLRQAPFKLFGYDPSFFRRVAAHHPVLLHAHFGPAGLTALPLARWLKIPLMVTFHGYDATVADAHLARSHYRVRAYLRNRHVLQKEAALFIAVSEFLRKQLIARSFPEKCIMVHYTGVDTKFFVPAPSVLRDPVVLFVGRLTEKKGCAYLLRAMHEVEDRAPAAELVVIGDGPLRQELEELAKRTLRSCRFLGWQPPETVRAWMNRARVFCLPSVRAATGDGEGFGMVFAEAQAMGLPVASFSSGGVPEAVLDGETGLLAAERDWRSLAKNILALLNNDHLWRNMSEAGQKRVREFFDLEKQTAKLEQTYRTLLEPLSGARHPKPGFGWQKAEGESYTSRTLEKHDSSARPRLAFVQSFCSHYTVGLFNLLAQRVDTEFFFFSDGKERYWQDDLGIRSGDFPHTYLRGFWLRNTRIAPALPFKLLSSRAQAILSCIDGKFALPVAYVVARWKRVPFLLWTGLWCRVDTPLQRWIFPLTRFLYQHADGIVAYGEHVKRYLVSEGVRPERIFIAPHAVDNSLYSRTVSGQEKQALREKLGILPDQKVILYVGRLEKIKGLHCLLNAFGSCHLSGAMLVIAGDGSQRRALQNLAQQLGMARQVRFVGYVPPEETVAYYALSSVVVLPSVSTAQGKEAWGLVVNEAFNQSIPVVATDAVGAVSGGLLEDQKNGVVVPEGDASALARALEKIWEDPVARERMGTAAKHSIRKWDHALQASGFLLALQEVLHQRLTVSPPAISEQTHE
jgi:colanic acid/amylovoran biosynthesis glycosyltransferase